MERVGDRLYVGAPRAGGCSLWNGAIYVLQRQAGGPFLLLAKVVGDSAGCVEEHQLGATLAVLDGQLIGHSVGGNVHVLRAFDASAAAVTRQWRLPVPRVPTVGAALAPWAAGDPGATVRIRSDGTTLAVGVMRTSQTNQPGILLYELGAGACDAAGLCACLPGYAGPECSVEVCQTNSACDDGNPCTQDACQDDGAGVFSCSNAPLTGPCQDGNACTEGDTCQADVCAPGAAKVCTDGNPCTQDACLSSVGCMYAASLSSACDDGKVCTKDDACTGKTGCSGTPVICDDGVACTIDACVEPTGCTATPAPNGTACDDGNACATAAACQGGACLPTSATWTACDDGDPCTMDACNPATGCVATWDGTATCGGTGTCALTGGCTCPPGQSLNAQGQCAPCNCPIAGAIGLVHAPQQALESPSLVPDSQFGYQVRVRGQRLFVASPGAHAEPESNPALPAAKHHGAIFVYERNAAGQFVVAQRLALSGAAAVAEARLGVTMAVDPTGKRVVARARYGHLANGQYAIGAKLWVFDEGPAGAWTAQGPLGPPAPIPSGAGYGLDGGSLDVEGDTIALGDPYRSQPSVSGAGRVVVYRRQPSGTWTIAQEIWGSAAGQQFGLGVDLDGGNLVASAIKEHAGTAVTRVFAWNGTSFAQTHAIPHPQPTTTAHVVHWAVSAALSGTTLVVNRQFLGGCASAAAHGGALYRYTLGANGAAQLVGKAFDSPADCSVDARFGTEFAFDGGLLYVANEDVWSHRHTLRSYHLGAAGHVRDQFAFLPVLTAPAGAPVSWSYTTGSGPAAPFLTWAHDIDAHQGRVAVGVQNGHQHRGFVVVYDPAAGACDAAGLCACAPGYAGPDCATQLCTDAAACNDNNPCTKDSCSGPVGATVCVHQPVLEGKCSDGNACTAPDLCKSGQCVAGPALPCDDGKPCTLDSCLPSIGCVHTALLVGPCDDGDPCTVEDICQPKVGCAGVPYRCDDGNVCTADLRLPPQAPGKPNTCKHVAVADGLPCADGDACTEADQCKFGVCVAGALSVWSDGDACTLDGCHPVTGCLFTPSSAAECQLPCDPFGSVPMHRTATEVVDPGVMRTHNAPVAPTPIALRGDTLIAGWSPFPGGAQSRLWVLRRVNGAWTLQQTLQSGSSTGGIWGHYGIGRDVAVSPDGGLIVALEPNLGRAMTWQRNSSGVYGQPIATAVNMPQSNPQWAAALHTDGVTLLINAPALTGPVYVWRWNGGAWQGTGSPNVLPAAAAPASGLALDGPSAALTGSPGANAGAGVVNLYTRNVAGVWGLVGQLSAATAVAGQGFGHQLARSGDVLAVTAAQGGCQPADATQPRPGHVAVLHRVSGSWQHHHTLQAPGSTCAPAAGFGAALTFDGGDLFVGAPRLPAPGVAGVLGAVLRYRTDAAGGHELIDALRPNAPLLPLTAQAPFGTTDQRRYGLAASASAGRVAVFSTMETTGPAKATRTTILEPVAGAANAFGQCVCKPGWSGKGCAVQACKKGADCDDSNPCTADICDPIADGGKPACVHSIAVSKATYCDDGNPCTEVDACQGDKCTGLSPKVCDDGKFCTTDACDPKVGACVFKTIIGCKG